jgi:hypothetical protein
MRRPPKRLTTTFIAAAGVLAVLFFTLPLTLPGSLRTRLASAIGQRFGGSVEIQDLRLSVFPRLRVAGDGVIVHRGTDVSQPPLIRIRSFSGEAGLFGLLGSRLHIREVRLEGLEINVPPGGVDIDGKPNPANNGGPTAAASPEHGKSPLLVDHLVSDNALLRILRREPEKKPREFAIATLRMEDTGADTPWGFTASLTNPTPPGRIETRGTFGPWIAAAPAHTPLAAEYTFHDANLGVFSGISGTLQSAGRFGGVLENIQVDGRADVADFALSSAGHPVKLSTTFHAIVDGTNGNTWLRPVDGTFAGTHVHAEGGVVERERHQGRTIALDVTLDPARIEDVLRLAVRTDQPAMSGGLKVRATFELPPGHVDAMQKLILKGTFTIDDARFAGDGIQAKVNDISRKARGADGPARDVVSDFSGAFTMAGGVIRFSRVGFTMPGARVSLDGSYAVASQGLDFKGTVRFDAKLSELTTGMKSMFLKVVEPAFRRNGKTVIPITIGGTAKNPKFGLDVGRAFTPR